MAQRLSAPLFIALLSLGLFSGCASDVERWDGEGCQPACQELETEGSSVFSAVCLDENLDSQSCSGAGQITPSCAEGVLSCETSDGLPRCVGATSEARERPTCGL